MGQPISSPDIPHDTDCPRCVPPVGSRWGVGETPLYIFCTFSGLVDCGRSHHPAPNGLIMRMTQTVGNVCMWRMEGEIWKAEFIADRIAPNVSQLRLSDHDGWSFFTDQQLACPPELQSYANDQLNCIPMYGASEGVGTIWWNADLLLIALAFGMVPSDRLMYDVFPVSDDFEVHRFADERDHTNVKIKIP